MMINIEDYEKEKYIAFVDIIGFKRLVNDITKKTDYDPSFHNTDKDTFGTVKKFYDQVYLENYYEKDNEDLQITCISDCLIVSATSYSNILRFLFYLQNNLLCRDYDNNKLLTRGYLTKGKFIHDTSKNLIFGEAYQRAYLAEEKEAINPRIIVDPNILNQFQSNTEDQLKVNQKNNFDIEKIKYQMDYTFIKEKLLLRQDVEDNYYFIDYLLRKKIQKFPMRENIDDFCNRKIRESEGNANFIRKYKWLLHYYNEIQTLELTIEERSRLSSYLSMTP